ncbi:hypothetical protein [Mediterranea massiliensis]|nr:hypothetical protein [Mediterranea massiliensis]
MAYYVVLRLYVPVCAGSRELPLGQFLRELYRSLEADCRSRCD